MPLPILKKGLKTMQNYEKSMKFDTSFSIKKRETPLLSRIPLSFVFQSLTNNDRFQMWLHFKAYFL
jgi:hypothetical protein